MVGEIAGDVKNLLTRSVEQTERMNRMESRQDTVNDDHDARLQGLERMRGKLLGIAWLLPVVITVAGLLLREFFHG